MSGIELARGETLALGSAGRKDEPPSLYSMLNVYRELMKGIARSPDFRYQTLFTVSELYLARDADDRAVCWQFTKHSCHLIK